MMIIDDWIEDKLAERTFALGLPPEPDECAMFAGVLRAEAQAAGYTVDALEIACAGDVCSFIAGVMMTTSVSAAEIHGSTEVGASFVLR